METKPQPIMTFEVRPTPKQTRTLIIGAGEIGKSLGRVLANVYEVTYKDIDTPIKGQFDVLNVCYPYSADFVKDTKEYIKQYNPSLVIIHSTVKPGTTRAIGELAVHSPVHGKHPNLEQGIKTFVKYIGGSNPETIYKAESYLRMAGIDTEAISSPEASEISKIMCTSYYGWNIIFMKEMVKVCEENNVPFKEVYTNWNFFYNEGYEKLGMGFFKRPILMPVEGEIGGHCVVPNTNLMSNFITDTIRQRNEVYKGGKNENRKRK